MQGSIDIGIVKDAHIVAGLGGCMTSFITAACISPKFGLSIQKSQAISFCNAVLDSSKYSVGLFPTEKIGFESIVSICPSNRLNMLITDWNASEYDLKEFDEQGIEIVVEEQN